MSDTGASSTLAGPVWAAFRRHCHRFLRAGYEQALARIQNEPDEETDITGYICEGIENWFCSNPKESFCFFVKDDPPLPGSGRTGKRRPRTDIIIGYAAGARPEFFFESKRLHRTKAGASKYTGNNGMGCFLSGRYASKYKEVAMIAYVQTDLLEDWQTTLQAKVKKQKTELRLTGLEEITFPESFALEWASTHSRPNLAPVKILHVLLDCRRLSSENITPRL